MRGYLQMYSTRTISPRGGSRGGRRSCRSVYLALAVVVIFALFVYTPLPAQYDNQRDALVQHAKEHLAPGEKSASNVGPSLATTNSKYAFATLLAGDDAQQNLEDINHDNYFVATRILAYQILHAPETRSDSIPFIVLVTRKVTEAKRARLRLDGAIVIEAEPVPKPAWIHTDVSAWQDVFDKLRLFQLTQFDRIAFLDGDTILNRPLDGIFNDTACATQRTLTRQDAVKANESALPPSYVFAGQPEMKQIHHYPPSEATSDYPNLNYLNAGFFVLQPSLPLLDYYLSMMQIPNRFLPNLPEQNLLNEAHRRDGNMPWLQLRPEWNIHYPSVADLDGGVASLHEKWWAPGDQALGPYLMSWRWRMEGFYEAREGRRDTLVEFEEGG